MIAFAAITFLHVVVGEFAPKTLAIQKAEWITLVMSRPLILFYKVDVPVYLDIKWSCTNYLQECLDLKPVSENEFAHTEEELRIILSESYKSGEINQSEFKYVNKIFEFDNRIAKEIMVPRTEIVSLSKDDTIRRHFFRSFREEKYTRYPIIDGDKDHIIGMVNIKEMMTDINW